MILRYTSILIGFIIIIATAHVTIISLGGYADPHAILILAIAGGVAVGALAIGVAWSQGRWVLTACIALALVCGEAFGLVQTSERLIAAREAAQKPLQDALDRRAIAQHSVQRAQSELQSLSTSPRLEAALAAKKAADLAVQKNAALKGCASNCRKLLNAQVAKAAREVEDARKLLQQAKVKAEGRYEEAAKKLASIKLPAPKNGLASRLGWPEWVLDLLVAALGSIGANGLGASLLAFGAHTPKEEQEAVEKSGRLEPALRTFSVEEHAAQFGVACLSPVDGAQTQMKSIFEAYVQWCKASGSEPLPSREIGTAMSVLFEKAGVKVTKMDDQPVALNVAINSIEKTLVTAN